MYELTLRSCALGGAGNAHIARAVGFMVEHITEEVSLEDIARETSLSKFGLCRAFQQHFGQSPMRWLWELRIRLAAEYVRQASCLTLTTIAVHCGFSSLAHFSRSFREVMGASPTSFKRAYAAASADSEDTVRSSDFEVLSLSPGLLETAVAYMMAK